MMMTAGHYGDKWDDVKYAKDWDESIPGFERSFACCLLELKQQIEELNDKINSINYRLSGGEHND